MFINFHVLKCRFQWVSFSMFESWNPSEKGTPNVMGIGRRFQVFCFKHGGTCEFHVVISRTVVSGCFPNGTSTGWFDMTLGHYRTTGLFLLKNTLTLYCKEQRIVIINFFLICDFFIYLTVGFASTREVQSCVEEIPKTLVA